MREDLVGRLWSWSVHSGDPLFAEAAEEIERLKSELNSLKPKFFNNVEEFIEDLENNRELDIVEELEFFSEASNAKEIVVTMLSGEVFAQAAEEIKYLRSITNRVEMNKNDLILSQKACQILYWHSREDYLNNYPSQDYYEEIIEAQKIAAAVSKHVREEIKWYYYYQ